MAQSIEEIRALVTPWNLVYLTCKGPTPFDEEQGYALENFDDYFQFGEVLNKDEHFSNISDPPETKTHDIKYSDVITVRKCY